MHRSTSLTALACSRLLPIRDIKGDSRLTGVIWNALRELFETFSPVLQDRQVELVEPLVLSLLRMMGNLLTELVQAAPRGQEVGVFILVVHTYV